MAVRRAREAIAAIFGDIPDGLLGLMDRLGDDPLPDRTMYRKLYNLCSRREHRFRAKVLMQQGGSLSATHLEIIDWLDPVLVHPNILRRIVSISDAKTANVAMGLIRDTVSSATDEALRQSVASLGAKAELADLIERWLGKLDRPPMPPSIPGDDPDIAAVTTGRALLALGRRFRNCAARRIIYLAQGAEVLVEWRHPPGLVAQCRRLTNGAWIVAAIHGPRNGRVDPAAAAACRRKLQALGIPALTPGSTYPGGIGIRHLLGAWDDIGDTPGAVNGQIAR
jgi:hypothetical protein